MGCFTDQVKLTRALVKNLDEAVKEVKLLGEHEEESSQKITELEALCEKLRGDTQRLEEEKATLEEMVESRDELLMEITRETGLDRMGEEEEEEEEALKSTKAHYSFNPKSSFNLKRDVKRETPKPIDDAFICMFCGRAGHLDEFCFR
jgi:hypothetical protein